MSQPHEPQEIRLVLRARFAARDIGRLLKRLREAAQVTQAGLAKKCGIPYQNVSRIERGAREGKISTLNRFARASGTKWRSFCGRSDPARRTPNAKAMSKSGRCGDRGSGSVASAPAPAFAPEDPPAVTPHRGRACARQLRKERV